jgi:hypothetical protein
MRNSILKRHDARRAHHGAKNSTRMRFSESTTDLKLAGVKSMTSDGSSATTSTASRREMNVGIRILVEERDEKDKEGEIG